MLLKLLYLSKANLRNQFFIKDLVSHFRPQHKTLLLHEPYGPRLEDTRFVSKRLSAFFSESMVYNNAFSADRRKLFYLQEGRMQVDTHKIQELLTHIQLLIVGPVIKQDDQSRHASPVDMIQALRSQMEVAEVVLFAANAKSPLVAEKRQLTDEAQLASLLNSYEEEKEVLQLAYELRPATLASPLNY